MPSNRSLLQKDKASCQSERSALSGIFVLDLTRRYPAAYGTMFLGDFGAEVIKIDPPDSWYSYPGIDPGSEEFAAHLAVDRNKKSVIINLKTEAGREVFYKLVKKADVLVEGFRPGIMKQMKADYPALKAINPRLIYCSTSGYGQDGPYARLPGHDMNYSAIAGLLSLIGPSNGPPYLAGNFLADMAGAGLHTVIGILLALIARNFSGEGQYIDIGYLDGAVSLLAYEASHYFTTGVVPCRGKTQLTGGVAWANVYECKDGEYISIGAFEPALWENLCRLLGREDLISRQNDPIEKQGMLVSTLAGIFRTRTRDEWSDFFEDKNACVTPVYHLNETFEDPQVRHRKLVVEIEHPKLGKVKQLGIPLKLSSTPGEIRSLGVPPGTNTDEILIGLGYTRQQIAGLRESSAIG